MKWRSFVRIAWPLKSTDPWFKAPDTNWRDWTASLPGLSGRVQSAGVARGGKLIWVRDRGVWEEMRPEKLAEFEGRAP